MKTTCGPIELLVPRDRNETESSRFWLGVLHDLKACGVRDVFIFSLDGLIGLDRAIEVAFPKADIQRNFQPNGARSIGMW